MNNPFQTMLARTDLPAGYPVGTFAMAASPLVAEALGCIGFDWAIVDMEHTPLDLDSLVRMLQAIAGTPMVPITRVPWNDTVMVKRVLDAGAQTLMFPFVQNAEEARKAVAACKYTPQGVRGMAAMSRASRFGTVPDYFKVANNAISVVVQIETPQALADVDGISSTEGVDSVFLGPGDLSAAMGHVGNLMHPDVVAAMAKAVERCHAAGKPVGSVAGTPEAVAVYRSIGIDYVACASDLALMMRQCAAILSSIRSQKVTVNTAGY